MPEFSDFVRERKFLKNVTFRTLGWYQQAWTAWQKHSNGCPKQFVIGLRESGVSPVTVNSYSRALNAYFTWAGLPKIPKLKEEQKVLPIYTADQIGRIVAYRGRKRRLHALVLAIIDTGLRLDEALSLRIEDIDFENLLLRVQGKGQKQRLVPFSHELRKVLWKFCLNRDSGFVFATRHGGKLLGRNVLREFKKLCRQQGFEAVPRSIHALRHFFAVNYLRAGGSVFHLQKVLGHSSLQMTRRYSNLLTEDLQRVHDRASFLSRGRVGVEPGRRWA